MNSKEEKNTVLSVKYTTSILELIFQYLRDKEIIQAGKCCKTWNKVITTSPLVWKYITLELRIDKDLYELGKVSKKYTPYLSCISSFYIEVQEYFSFYYFRLQELFKYFENNSRRIEQIEFNFHSTISRKDVCRFLSRFTLPNLKKWTLNYKQKKEEHLEEGENFNLNKVFCHSTTLESISLKAYTNIFYGNNYISKVNHLKGLKRFVDTLKEVYFENIHFKNSSSLQILTQLTNLTKITLINNEFQSSLEETIELPEINMINNSISSPLFSFYQLTSLKELKLVGFIMVYLLPFFISFSKEEEKPKTERMELTKLTLCQEVYLQKSYPDFYLNLLKECPEFHSIKELKLYFLYKRINSIDFLSGFQNLISCELKFNHFGPSCCNLITLLAEKNSSSLENLIINSTQEGSCMKFQEIRKFYKLSNLNLSNLQLEIEDCIQLLEWSSLHKINMKEIKLVDSSMSSLIWKKLDKFKIRYIVSDSKSYKVISHCIEKEN